MMEYLCPVTKDAKYLMRGLEKCNVQATPPPSEEPGAAAAPAEAGLAKAVLC